MNIVIRRIGEILADGAIKGWLDKKTQGDMNSYKDLVLAKIRKKRTIAHSALLQSVSYKINAQEVSEIINILNQEGLITIDYDSGKIVYSIKRLSDISTLKNVDVSKKEKISANILSIKLTDEQIKQQLETPIIIDQPIWAFKNNLLGIQYYDYFKNDEIALCIKHYVLEHEKEIETIKEQIQFMEQGLKGEGLKRELIPKYIKIFVWQRDKAQCVKCGSKKNLEFDHDIPIAKGGSTTVRNIQLLCEECNRKKRDNIE